MTGPSKDEVERVREANRRAGTPSTSGTTVASPGTAIRTDGLSRKLLSAVVAAVGTQVVALLVNLISTGKFDKVEAAQLVGIALTAVFGVLAGYLSQPDKQTTAPKGK
jgi:hypothetical protein